MKIKKCAKACKRSGRKAKLPQPHESHVWIAGVYYPIGEVDGYEVLCPGYQL